MISGERIASEQTYEQICSSLDESFRPLEDSVLLPGSRAFQIHLQHLKRVQADARGQAILLVGAKALTVQETFQVVKDQLADLFLLVHRPKVLYATNNQWLIHPIQVDCFDEDPNSGETRITMSDGQSISVVETLSEIEQGLNHCQLRQAIKDYH